MLANGDLLLVGVALLEGNLLLWGGVLRCWGGGELLLGRGLLMLTTGGSIVAGACSIAGRGSTVEEGVYCCWLLGDLLLLGGGDVALLVGDLLLWGGVLCCW